jgi:fructoselysine 6-kinase
MYDFVAIGNVSIDLYFKGESLTRNEDRFQLAIGGKYFADTFYEDIGGGGCNVAAGVANFGYNVGLLCKIGNNSFKDAILRKLQIKKISTDLCQYQDDYHKISTILLTDKGERTIINYETPTTLWQEFNLSSDIKKARNIYLGALPHLRLADKIKIVDYFKGPEVLTFINLAVPDCKRSLPELQQIFNGIDVLIVNGHEYSELIKKPYGEIDFMKHIVETPILKDRVLIVTDGEKGSYGYFNNQIIFQPAVSVTKIIDTTGCGDAYTAGFIAEYIKSKDTKRSMQNGAEYAAKKLQRIGAN